MKKNLFFMLVLMLTTLTQCQKSKQEDICNCGEAPIVGVIAQNWGWESSKNLTTHTVVTTQSAGYTEKMSISVSSTEQMTIVQYRNDNLMTESYLTILSKDEMGRSIVVKNNRTNLKRKFTYDRNDGMLRVSEEVNENDNFTNSEEHIYKAAR
ncbi:MAG: hypothetical protein RL757_812 [Bacteroidota bacterium]|jgi:hypothetical protein